MERASVLMLVLALQFFMFFTEESLAIQCYKCEGSNCNDPFVTTGVSTCTGRSCSKTKGTSSGIQYIIRNCSDSASSFSCQESTILGVQVTACVCNTDWCNDSTKVGGLSGLILILSIGSLAFLLKFH